MAKENSAPRGGLLQELFQFNVYKRSQGRVTRQVTFAALAIIVAIGAWKLYGDLKTSDSWLLTYMLPGVILLAGLWFSFRLVNTVRFADFLIAVEAEMSKVSWPTRAELMRSSIIVILVIFLLALSLLIFDAFWIWLFVKGGIILPT